VPTGVFSDHVFLIDAPLFRLDQTTSTGVEDVASFDGESYPQIDDRWWKDVGFFFRIKPCPLQSLIRYLSLARGRCDLKHCTARVYARDVHLTSLSYDPAMITGPPTARRGWSWASSRGTAPTRRWPADGAFAPTWTPASGAVPGDGRGARARLRRDVSATVPAPYDDRRDARTMATSDVVEPDVVDAGATRRGS